MKESIYPVSGSKELLRFTATSESDALKKGFVSTDTDYSNGLATFNGTSSKVDTGSDMIGTKAVTIVARIKLTSGGEGSSGTIFSNGKTLLRLSAGTRVLFQSDGSGGGGTFIFSAADSIANDIWYHVVVVREADGSGGRIYINGEQNGTSGSTGTPEAGTSNVIIGNNNAQNSTFDGDIDFVRVIDEVWTAKDVELDYKNMLYQPVQNSVGGSDGCIGRWDLSRDSSDGSTTMYDTSGQGNNGTITAGASDGFVKDQLGRAGKAYNFDGADTKIDTGSDMIGTEAVTIVARIYPESLGEGAQGRIISNGKTIFRLANVDRLKFSSDGSTLAEIPTSIQLNAWNHIVVTRNSAGDETNFYINGVLSGSPNQNSGTPTAGTSNVIIGNRDARDRTFDGSISDVRIYNYVLTPTQIRQIYEREYKRVAR